MKRKAIIPLVLGLGIGLFTVKLAVDTIRKAQAANANAETVNTVRAKIDIHAHERVTQEMVELVEIAADSALIPKDQRFDELKLVVGRVTAKAIPTSSPILKSMLAPEGSKPGMVGRIPPGYRAVSVKIDEVSSGGYHIKPGDMVDVLVVMDVDSGIRGRKETISEVILQNVKVAAIGHTMNPPQGGSNAKAKPAKSATLFVRNRDVPKLHLANTRGKISLAMRGSDDPNDSMSGYANMGDVLYGGKPKKKNDKGEVSLFLKMLGFGKDTKDKAKLVKYTQPVDSGPRTVLVVRGGSAAENMQRITFAHSDSTEIIAVSAGAASKSSTGIGSRNRRRNNP